MTTPSVVMTYEDLNRTHTMNTIDSMTETVVHAAPSMPTAQMPALCATLPVKTRNIDTPGAP